MSYRKFYLRKTEEEVIKASNKESLGKNSRTISFIGLESGCALLIEFYDDQSSDQLNGEGRKCESPKIRSSIDMVVEEQVAIGQKLAQNEEVIIEYLKQNLPSSHKYNNGFLKEVADKYDESNLFIEELARFVIQEETDRKIKEEKANIRSNKRK